MMYNNKLVASVKVGGKIMREDGETVYLPFGSEYSLLLKNLNTRKALVKVEIDGEDVTGGGLIISPNQTVDFERYILDNNLDTGPKFRFIEKTEGISQHRGDKIEDGLVRVVYQFEAASLYTTTWITNTNVYGGTLRGSSGDFDGGHSFYNANVGCSLGTNSVDGIAKGSVTSNLTHDANVNDAGITTKGSDSDQKFSIGSIGTLETVEHAIVLNLKGQVGQHVVQRPVTVQVRFKCDICGKSNIPSGNKFCPQCGTNLTVKY